MFQLTTQSVHLQNRQVTLVLRHNKQEDVARAKRTVARCVSVSIFRQILLKGRGGGCSSLGGRGGGYSYVESIEVES